MKIANFCARQLQKRIRTASFEMHTYNVSLRRRVDHEKLRAWSTDNGRRKGVVPPDISGIIDRNSRVMEIDNQLNRSIRKKPLHFVWSGRALKHPQQLYEPVEWGRRRVPVVAHEFTQFTSVCGCDVARRFIMQAC